MANKKAECATALSTLDVPRAVVFDEKNYGVVCIDASESGHEGEVEPAVAIPDTVVYVTPTQAERDLDVLIEAQKIRRDPERLMAAKALPKAHRHYIV